VTGQLVSVVIVQEIDKPVILVCNLSGKTVSILKFLKGLQGSCGELQTMNSDFCKAEPLDMLMRKGWVNRKISIAHYVSVNMISVEEKVIFLQFLRVSQ